MAIRDAAKYIPLNFALMASPINWVVVALIVVMAGVGLAAIISPNNAPAKEIA